LERELRSLVGRALAVGRHFGRRRVVTGERQTVGGGMVLWWNGGG